jgi:hypothetical protein
MNTPEQLIEKRYPYMRDEKSDSRYEEYSGNDIIAIKRLSFKEGYKAALKDPELLEALQSVNKYFVILQNRCALTRTEEKVWAKVSKAIQQSTE